MKEAGTPITIGAYEDDHSEAGSVPEEREPVCSEFSGPSGSVVKNPSASSGDAGGRGFSPWVGKTPPEEEMATHSSILAGKNPMDRGIWRATVHGVAKHQTQLGIHTHTVGRKRHELYGRIVRWGEILESLKEISPGCSLEGQF